MLVQLDGSEGERRSSAGIVIPATASMGRRLAWATAVGVGPHVRSIVVGDRVLFDPEDRSEVELHGRDYILLRERDVHAVAARGSSRTRPASTCRRRPAGGPVVGRPVGHAGPGPVRPGALRTWW